ncbi:unnamed protein product [Arabidopsis lyrata]|uniref:Predicted protein n=1 Tax=Arabidopsis lyrata subsp. lyrata TaxID=81972 RepID=D7LBW3_ARALL|nr:predicted protein [Arabidopsis lyrata subsp. lyrata]CAH8266020.1 unnamed protein product [Arabidopsis lyrata]
MYRVLVPSLSSLFANAARDSTLYKLNLSYSLDCSRKLSKSLFFLIECCLSYLCTTNLVIL